MVLLRWTLSKRPLFQKTTEEMDPNCLKIKNEKSAQRVSFWDGHPADIPGSFARISRLKTSVRVLKIPEKQAFGRGHP